MTCAVKGKGPGTEWNRTSKWARRMIHSHIDWESNRLPRAGGLDDQPNKWVTAMRILDGAKAAASIKIRKEREKKAGRKAHG